MSEEKRAISRVQLDALHTQRIFHDHMLTALTNYLYSGEPRYQRTFELMLLQNSKRKRSKYVPDCHILPKSHLRALYVAALETVDYDTLNRSSYMIVTSNPLKSLKPDEILYTVNDYIPICCISTLLDYLNKRVNRYKSRGEVLQKPASEKLAALLDSLGPDMYLVKLTRYIDMCDIVAIYNEDTLNLLPSVVSDRIKRFDLHHVYDKL